VTTVAHSAATTLRMARSLRVTALPPLHAFMRGSTARNHS
jgi:hypothetical protein